MLVTCTGCQSKMIAPDSLAGKRVQCPKCGEKLRVPGTAPGASEVPPVADAPGSPPDAIEPVTVEPLPEPMAGTEVSAGTPSKPVAKKPAPVDAGYEDDDDSEEPPRRRDLHDDDYINVTKGMGRKPVNGMALASMIMGIVSVSLATIGCFCCGIIGASLALICGILAVVFGFMGREPGSESYTLTGFICGGIGIAFSLLGIIAGIFWIGMNMRMGNF